MGSFYDSRPNISTRPYLQGAGKTQKNKVIAHLNTAIEDMEAAAQKLLQVKGLGAELYIERLDKEIDKMVRLRTAIKRLD